MFWKKSTAPQYVHAHSRNPSGTVCEEKSLLEQFRALEYKYGGPVPAKEVLDFLDQQNRRITSAIADNETLREECLALYDYMKPRYLTMGSSLLALLPEHWPYCPLIFLLAQSVLDDAPLQNAPRSALQNEGRLLDYIFGIGTTRILTFETDGEPARKIILPEHLQHTLEAQKRILCAIRHIHAWSGYLLLSYTRTSSSGAEVVCEAFHFSGNDIIPLDEKRSKELHEASRTSSDTWSRRHVFQRAKVLFR